jgi:hypothetical protein
MTNAAILNLSFRLARHRRFMADMGGISLLANA